MEKCRCEELERCYGDIIKIQDAVGRINKLYPPGSGIHEQLEEVSKGTRRSLSANNLTRICALVKVADSGLEKNTDDLLYQVNSYLYSLRHAYDAMKNEDTLYHERLQLETEQAEE